jgi:hypothetical protein
MVCPFKSRAGPGVHFQGTVWVPIKYNYQPRLKVIYSLWKCSSIRQNQRYIKVFLNEYDCTTIVIACFKFYPNMNWTAEKRNEEQNCYKGGQAKSTIVLRKTPIKYEIHPV